MEAKAKSVTFFQVIGIVALFIHIIALTLVVTNLNTDPATTLLDDIGLTIFMSWLVISTISMACITLNAKNRFSIPSIVFFALLALCAWVLPPLSVPLIVESSSRVPLLFISGALIVSPLINILYTVFGALNKE